MTPEEALALLAEQHRPCIPRVLDVSEDGHGWREATLEDRMDSMEWWCDACGRPASRCYAAPILALAGVRLDD